MLGLLPQRLMGAAKRRRISLKAEEAFLPGGPGYQFVEGDDGWFWPTAIPTSELYVFLLSGNNNRNLVRHIEFVIQNRLALKSEFLGYRPRCGPPLRSSMCPPWSLPP